MSSIISRYLMILKNRFKILENHLNVIYILCSMGFENEPERLEKLPILTNMRKNRLESFQSFKMYIFTSYFVKSKVLFSLYLEVQINFQQNFVINWDKAGSECLIQCVGCIFFSFCKRQHFSSVTHLLESPNKNDISTSFPTWTLKILLD